MKKIQIPSIVKTVVNQATKSTASNKLFTQSKNFATASYAPTVGSEMVKAVSYKFPEFLTRSAPTQITTLPNGFRVVTEPRVGETAAVGVFIGAGSRHEDINNNGVAHFLEHMYFKGTQKRSSKDLEVEYENAGSYMNAHTSREYTAFTSHCLRDDVDRSVDSLADVLLNSRFDPQLIESEKSTIIREMEEVNTNIEEVLFDNLHATAFQGSSLGFTILGPKENILRMTRQQMINYRSTYYTAPRMVLVGVGNVDHSHLVKLGEKYFNQVPAKSLGATPETRYVGSDIQLYNPEIPFMHLAIGFEGPSISSPDILVLNVIQLLIGSYDKAMGIGKHVSTSFCSKIAEKDLARSVVPFNHAYSDTGLFGVHIVSDGGKDTDTLMVSAVSEMTRLCYKVNDIELERAKNLLKSQMLASYEGGLSGVLEEVGRQMLFYGRRPSVAEMFARIDAITSNDVRRVATKYIYDKDPVIASIGKTEESLEYSWLRIHTYQWRQ
jgi:processing peptidase subunit beta